MNIENHFANYNLGVKFLGVLSFIIVVASIGGVIGMYVKYTNDMADLRGSILVMDWQGGIHQTKAYQLEDLRDVEYRKAVSDFMTLWFEHNADDFRDRVSKGLDLLGECGKDLVLIYNKEKRASVLRNYNLDIKFGIDKVEVDMTTYPVQGKATGIQVINDGKNTIEKEIRAVFTIQDYGRRSDKNPHAIQINDFEYTERLIEK